MSKLYARILNPDNDPWPEHVKFLNEKNLQARKIGGTHGLLVMGVGGTSFIDWTHGNSTAHARSKTPFYFRTNNAASQNGGECGAQM